MPPSLAELFIESGSASTFFSGRVLGANTVIHGCRDTRAQVHMAASDNVIGCLDSLMRRLLSSVLVVCRLTDVEVNSI
jgi:hypothetical protein